MSSRFDLNNKYNYTKSLKLDNTIKIKNLMIDKIDNHPEIKRLMAYTTQTPLSKVGITYDNKKVQQPDITESLTVSGIQNPHECLIGYPFCESMINEAYPLMFVYCPRSILGTNQLGTNIYEIDVIVDYTQNKLKTPLRGERGIEILARVADLFDGYTLQGEESEGIGNITFSVEGDVSISRLSKNTDIIVYSMNIQTKVSNARVYDV